MRLPAGGFHQILQSGPSGRFSRSRTFAALLPSRAPSACLAGLAPFALLGAFLAFLRRARRQQVCWLGGWTRDGLSYLWWLCESNEIAEQDIAPVDLKRYR